MLGGESPATTQGMNPAAQQSWLAQKLRATRHLLILDNLESVTGEHLSIRNTLNETERNAVRGFLGEYELTADVAGGPVTRTLDLSSTDTTRVVLSRSTTAAEAAPGVPAAVTLAQNYPNPFNPQTVIRYGLAAPAHVRLDVFDALGRTVARLVDAQRGAGWHEAIFTADALPGGVYFYRLTAGAETRTGRMLLAK